MTCVLLLLLTLVGQGDHLGDTKVRQFGMPIIIDENIFALEIAMNNLHRMQIVKTACNLESQVQLLLPGQCALVLPQIV